MNAQRLKTINRVELMPNIPSPFQMRDWKALAKKYDEFVFNFDLTGDFLPLIWWDKTDRNLKRDTFGLPSFVDYPSSTFSVIVFSVLELRTRLWTDFKYLLENTYF